MTDHSLGARVALTALSLLGERSAPRRLNQLFLWQPAVLGFVVAGAGLWCCRKGALQKNSRCDRNFLILPNDRNPYS
ncbi:hypothetical protein SAMN02745148_03723 [Modicisalibacter ilicicola DSM 19980]|uniref:Uncharacterized protein n=1 Tax=Modicisalibacter ilicicola DSM 19980 TaxID=1121942 RepID=A0A1M5F5H5_9GAMM|nr:hypothetical protein [Halomonas ilicicola]SHF86850.1 hypothetical protein SAMN02745148_03723 [Halomonas ilicicola DSM 19980]